MERGLSSESSSVSGPPTPSEYPCNQYTSKPSEHEKITDKDLHLVNSHAVEKHMLLLGFASTLANSFERFGVFGFDFVADVARKLIVQ